MLVGKVIDVLEMLDPFLVLDSDHSACRILLLASVILISTRSSLVVWYVFVHTEIPRFIGLTLLQTIAATFDRGLFYQRGNGMGSEHYLKGVDSQLGPVVGMFFNTVQHVYF